jgi:hypothetical protein
MKPIRVYADTSVFGGVFDSEFEFASRLFFRKAKSGVLELVTSVLTREELGGAPVRVVDFFEDAAAHGMLVSDIAEDAVDLQLAYVSAGILGESSMADALHVGMATALGCNVIVSWNFKHIVHFQKIPLYNAVNATRGFPAISIHSPHEVVSDEDESV